METDTNDSSESESGSDAEDITRPRSKIHGSKTKGNGHRTNGHRTRAPRNSKGRRQVRFTQLQAYPGQWRSVLEDAKKRNRCTTAIKAGFLKRREGLKQAEDSLVEAMAAHEAEDGVVENGT
jgi:hypothetical protein